VKIGLFSRRGPLPTGSAFGIQPKKEIPPGGGGLNDNVFKNTSVSVSRVSVSMTNRYRNDTQNAIWGGYDG